MKKGLKILIAVLAVVLILGVLFFINKKQDNTVCQKVSLDIKYPAADTFLVASDVKEYLHIKFPQIEGTTIANLKISEIERYLDLHPYIADAEVYTSFNGTLSVTIKQRQPVVRIVDYTNNQFYMDAQGMRMPLSNKTVSYVPIASGYIASVASDTLRKYKVYQDIVQLTKAIDADLLMKNQIDQIYVNSKQEFELIPKVGNQLIVLGKAEDIEKKFDKLKIYYEQGIPKVGWTAYRTINLKFENQIVCTK